MVASTPLTIDLKGYITTSEAAVKLGVTSGYVRKLAAMKALPEPVRVRGADTVFHSETDIEEYARTHPKVGLKRRSEQSA